jgi:hypothetical protein
MGDLQVSGGSRRCQSPAIRVACIDVFPRTCMT